MDAAILDNALPHNPEFNLTLKAAVERIIPTVETFDHREVEADPTVLADFGVVISSGVPRDWSPQSIENRTNEIDWLDETDERKTYLGVCLGAQSLAMYFGGKIYENPEEGPIDLQVRKPGHPLLRGFEDGLSLHTNHGYSFKLPRWTASELAVGGKGTQLAQIRGKNIYLLQSHLEGIVDEHTGEVVNTHDGEKLLNNFIDMAEATWLEKTAVAPDQAVGREEIFIHGTSMPKPVMPSAPNAALMQPPEGGAEATL